MTMDGATPTVEEFRAAARVWLAANMRRLDAIPATGRGARAEDFWANTRGLQRRVWDGGFAGICWPVAYGGLGLSPAHQRAFTEEAQPYEMPNALNVPTFGILAPTLLDFGTPEQLQRHITPILRGEELWVQFLSEPSGGSDLAGCITRADRDGDVFVINGSKIWSSSAMASDYAMCLARTNWDVPKHRGLTMFIIKIHQPGVQVEAIRQVNGSREFCQEFFDDLVVPAADVVGAVDDGWAVASRLLSHERTAVGGASIYTSGRPMVNESSGADTSLVRLARQLGVGADPLVRQAVAEYHVDQLVYEHLRARVTKGLAAGTMPAASGSLLKLAHATIEVERARLAIEIAGSDAAIAVPGGGGLARVLGDESLSRQAMSLGGGTNEIQRNIISERILGMPREWAADRDIPYRDVRRTSPPNEPGPA